MANIYVLIFFAGKKLSRLCTAKATHILQQNINVFENTLAITVNEFVISELVKLSMF